MPNDMPSYMHETIQVEENLPAQVNIITEEFCYNVPYHWHRSLEIDYSIHAQAKFYINGVEGIMEDDDLVLVNSGEIHIVNAIVRDSLEVVSIIFSRDFLKSRWPDFDNCCFRIQGNPEKEREVKTVMKAIYVLFSEKTDECYIWRANELLYHLLDLLFRYFCTKKNQKVQGHTEKYLERFKIIMEHIDRNSDQNLTLEDVADYYGISREHLARNFRKYMGQTFKEYLDSIRLNQAYTALLNTDLNILEIAVNSGFADDRAFSRCFKAVYGKTPYQYKKEHHKAKA